MRKIAKYLLTSCLAPVFTAALFFSCDKSAPNIPYIIEEKTPDYSVSAIMLNPDLAAKRDYWPTEEWRTKNPQDVGMDPTLLEQMLQYIKKDNVCSLIIIRNGYMVLEHYAESYGQSSFFTIYSCTKSVVSTLIGMLIDQGKIDSVNQRLADFFPEIEKMPDPQKEKILLEHALTMTAGFDWPSTVADESQLSNLTASRDWTRFVLERPVVKRPGEVFNYNTGVSHLLSSIITRTAGMPAEDFAVKYLFGKIGIEQVLWLKDRQGNSTGGFGLSMHTRDMARFGFLFLNNGVWNGEHIVSRQWIKAATADHVGGFPFFDRTGFYGYQWWIDSNGTEKGKFFLASGYRGQYIYIVPAMDLVVVFTSNLSGRESGNPRTYLLSYIMPACRENQSGDIVVKKIDPFYYCALKVKGGADQDYQAFQTLLAEKNKQSLLIEITPLMIYDSNKVETPAQEAERELGFPLVGQASLNAPLILKKWEHVWHASKIIAGNADMAEQKNTINSMRDWIRQNNYKVSGPLLIRLIPKPFIEDNAAVERMEFLLPIEK